MRRAFYVSSRREHRIYNIPEADVTFDLISPENVVIGEDFELKVKMKNKTEEERTVTAKVTAVVSFYTGVPSERVGAKSWTRTLAPNAGWWQSGCLWCKVFSQHSLSGTALLKGQVYSNGLTVADPSTKLVAGLFVKLMDWSPDAF